MKLQKDSEFLIKLEQSIGDKMDEIESKMAENENLLVFPLIHRFTDGLYVREVHIDGGVLVTSKTHLTQHQFFLLKGKALVWNNEGEATYIEAPHIGITEANTRRLVYVIEDCVWATCHPNEDNKVLEDLEQIIFEDYDNKYLTDSMKQRIKEVQQLSAQSSVTIDNKLITN
jgi:hypothetical protein